MVRKIQKIIQNQSGMGLVGILFTAAVVGAIGFTMLQYMENSNRVSKYNKAKAELDVVHRSYLALLRNPDSCMLTFKNKAIGGSGISIDLEADPKSLKRATTDVNGNLTEDTTWEANAPTKVGEELLPPKIKLIKIVVYNPYDANLPLLAPKPPSKDEDIFTSEGWVTTVAFHYEMYKPQEGKKNMMAGPYNQVKFAMMIFDNFKYDSIRDSNQFCNSNNKGVSAWIFKDARTSNHYSHCFDDSLNAVACSSTEGSLYGNCYDAKLANSIEKCSAL